jgi:drug/metabolite transporter (DMT)-like permease
MAQVVTIEGQQYKRRNVFAVWLGLPLITLGVYYFVWYYKINDESRRYLRDPSIQPVISLLAILLGWVLIVPPFISIYQTAARVRRMQVQAGVSNLITPWIALVLVFVFGLDRLYLQMSLNDVWDRHLLPWSGHPISSLSPPPAAPPSITPPPPLPPAAP